jgi:hypothetical protein
VLASPVLLDRDDEATEIVDVIAEITINDDLDGQIAWRRLRATLLARKEQYLTAEEVAREAVSLATQTDYAYQQTRMSPLSSYSCTARSYSTTASRLRPASASTCPFASDYRCPMPSTTDVRTGESRDTEGGRR